MSESLLGFVFKDKDILKRILVTLLAVVFARLIYFLPAPGISLRAVFQFYDQYIHAQGGGLFDLVALLHAGKLRGISVFALGIMPYINACVIIQLIGYWVPGVNKKFFDENSGRKKMLMATLVTAIVLSMMHAYSISSELELVDKFPDFKILSINGLGFKLALMASMSAACVFLVALSRVINRFGIGNGLGVIFASEVLVRLGLGFSRLVQFYVYGAISSRQILMFLLVFMIFIYFVRAATVYVKKLSLKTHTGEEFTISVRPYWVGVWPLIIAELFLSFFKISLDWTSFIIICFVIAFFALAYVKVVYQPRWFYELILPYECITCDEKKQRLIDVLNNTVFPCTGFAFVLLLLLYYFPVVLPFALKVSFVSSGIFGAFGVIVLIGVCYDIFRQIEFFRKIRQYKDVKKWSLLIIARDESEAEVKKACLVSHGIITEVKPSHFIWGLPVRTAASGYYVFVPHEKIKEAAQILKELKNAWTAKAI
ncbi:MAG: hypothetical protein ABII88_03615 [Candidatus Omnitrophota bacterium]